MQGDLMSNKQHMFFKSKKYQAHWDTWMYYYKGIYYLYYLITEHSGGEGFGVAISEDGASWIDKGEVLRASEKMANYLGTGAVWKAHNFSEDGFFICNYSEWRKDETDKETQNIFFARSKDLVNWEKYDDSYIFPVDTTLYERYGRWDCIYPIKCKDGGYYGTWTATPIGRGDLNGGIGFGYSHDGLHWQALQPFEVIPDADEAGAIIPINDKYFAMFGKYGTGMVGYSASDVRGPYTECRCNPIVLSDYTYFSRFLQIEDSVLVNHHAISRFKNIHGRPICYFAPLKGILIKNESIWLTYWHGNDILKEKKVDLNFYKRINFDSLLINMADKKVKTSEGIIIEGNIYLNNQKKNSLAGGIFIRHDISNGTCIFIMQNGEVKFVSTEFDKNNLKNEYCICREWQFDENLHFRVLLKQSVVEIYFDNIYISSYSMQGESDGNIGLINIKNITEFIIWETNDK